MYTQRKIHSGFVGSILLVAALILLFAHTRPVQRKLDELKNTVAQLQQEVGVFRGAPQEENEMLAADISEVEKKELDQAIPEAMEQDIIMSDLNRIAKTADVSFNALTFSLDQKGALPTINISAGFHGVAANIIRFVKMLEVNPRKLLVKDAGITRSESTGGLELMNLNITMQAFYRNNE
jgi:hypothetical protein